MKKFLAKFKISSALDAGEGVPEKLRRGANRSADVGDFLERAETLERALKREKLPESVPAGLHSSIMRAVAESRQTKAEPREPRVLLPRWVPAMGVAVLLVVAGLWGLRIHEQNVRKAASADTLAVATEALEKGREFAQTLPAKVMEPVSGELKKINEDVDKTAKFVLASIPLDGLSLASQ